MGEIPQTTKVRFGFLLVAGGCGGHCNARNERVAMGRRAKRGFVGPIWARGEARGRAQGRASGRGFAPFGPLRQRALRGAVALIAAVTLSQAAQGQERGTGPEDVVEVSLAEMASVTAPEISAPQMLPPESLLSLQPMAADVRAQIAGQAGFLVKTQGEALLISERPLARPWEGPRIPKLRWDGRRGAAGWSFATITAVERHSRRLTAKVPRDIETFCPAYASASKHERTAFWAALVSGIARYESHFKPKAAGGGGQWIGLMQIAPRTAQYYGCALPEGGTVAGLQDGGANLACAVRILARQVGRDGAIAGKDGAWRGAARDWAVMRTASKRANIAEWTRKQPYCQIR